MTSCQSSHTKHVPRTIQSNMSTASSGSSSLYAHRGNSSRNNRYGSKPQVVIHNGGGTSTSPNSGSADNSGYYK